ncbi:MAG: hypothetical protein J7576_08295 [Siphonobacter aquaeclarae]|nr:hypothetical protein [Siphonobacter aquaeclarae]
MKKFLIAAALAATSCTQQPQPVRDFFDAGNLTVITAFANTHQKTMALLFGNTAAGRSARAGYRHPEPGAVFRLAIFEQTDNQNWYGSRINGAVRSVESVSVVAGGRLIYRLEQGSAPGKPTARIAVIFAHRPAVFPPQL